MKTAKSSQNRFEWILWRYNALSAYPQRNKKGAIISLPEYIQFLWNYSIGWPIFSSFHFIKLFFGLTPKFYFSKLNLNSFIGIKSFYTFDLYINRLTTLYWQFFGLYRRIKSAITSPLDSILSTLNLNIGTSIKFPHENQLLMFQVGSIGCWLITLNTLITE